MAAAGLPAAGAPAMLQPAEMQQALEDVEAKRHKRNPFASQFVSLATTPFGEGQGGAATVQHGVQAGAAGRSAVEAAATAVHVRTELIRSMKNALVKQTAEAVKRATPAPPARARLGSRARRAAAGAAAAVDVGAGQTDAGGAEGVPALFGEADEQLHQQFQQLLQGTFQPGLDGLMQGLLHCEGDSTRLCDAELSLDLAAEVAPLPFDEFVRGLLGKDQRQQDLAVSEHLTVREAAGLAAALEAVRQHTVHTEQQGMLQVAAPASTASWLCLDGQDVGSSGMLGFHGGETAEQPWDDPMSGLPPLPAHLLGSPQRHGPHEQGVRGAGGATVQPVPGSMQDHQCWQGHVRSGRDAIQDADGGGIWDVLEEADSQLEPPGEGQPGQVPLRFSHLAPAGVAVTFDDEQQHAQQVWDDSSHAGLAGLCLAAQPPGLQAGLVGRQQDPWAAFEEAGSGDQIHSTKPNTVYPQQQGRRVPVFASRQPLLALRTAQQHQEQPVPGHAAGSGAHAPGSVEEDEEDGWDDDMLLQVAALEEQAVQARGRGRAGSSQQPLRAPVIPRRAFTQHQSLHGGAWPATSAAPGGDGIEEADSDEDLAAPELPGTASEVGREAAQGAEGRPAMQRAIPQLGRVRSLPLGPVAAAAIDPSTQPAAMAGGGPVALAVQRHGQQAAAQEAAADSQLLCIDFESLDVAAMRPSVLLERQAGGKQRWKPVFDPEALLLPQLRPGLMAALQQPLQGQHVQQTHPQVPQCSHEQAAAAELAGLTAEDLAGWDDWSEDESGGSGAEHVEQQEASYRCECAAMHQGQAEGEPHAVALHWDDTEPEPALPADSAAVPTAATAGYPPGRPSRWNTHSWQQANAGPAEADATLAADLPALDQAGIAPVAAAAVAAAAEVDICFDDEEGGRELGGGDGWQGVALHGAWWACATGVSQHGSQGFRQLSQPGATHLGPSRDQPCSPSDTYPPYPPSSADAAPASACAWDMHACALPAQQEHQAQGWQQKQQFRQQQQPGALWLAAGWPAVAAHAGEPSSEDAAKASAELEPATTAVPELGADVWATFEAAPGAAGSDAEGLQSAEAVEAAVLVWEDDGQQPASSAPNNNTVAHSAATAPANGDPWAALEGRVGPAHRSAAQQTSGSSDLDASVNDGNSGSVSAGLRAQLYQLDAASPVASVLEEDFGSVWGCDIQWEDDSREPAESAQMAGWDACTQAAAPSQQDQGAGCANLALPGRTATAGSAQTFDLEYCDDVEIEGSFSLAGPGMGAAASQSHAMARLAAALLGGEAGGAAGAVHAASKRRHEDIGAEIIRALLEERHRERADLQPLLARLCQSLAAAMAGGGASPVLLSTLRSECLACGAAGTDASPQRYFMALLTAVHQHNSGAVIRAQQVHIDPAAAGSSGAVTSAAALLAAALGERQLHLVCGNSAADVEITT